MISVFKEARIGLEKTGASVWSRELVALLERHAAEEGAILSRYQQAATSAESPAVRYLVNLILEDERRHHRVMEELANAVAWDGFNPDDGNQVPDGLGKERPELIEETRRLRDFERQDARELTELRERFRDFSKTTIWGLLVDTMLLDTRKHQLILDFILKI